MEIGNCRYCGKMFHYFSGERLCPRCKDVLEERFRQVKEYIYDHPEVGPQEVANEFEISVSTIYRWVRQERLMFSENSTFGLPCESCGETLKMGRFCQKCKNTLGKKLHEMYKEEPESVPEQGNSRNNPKMRFLQE